MKLSMKISEVFQAAGNEKEFTLHKPTIPGERLPATRPGSDLIPPFRMVYFLFCKVWSSPSNELANLPDYPSPEGGKIVPLIWAKMGEVSYTQ